MFNYYIKIFYYFCFVFKELERRFLELLFILSLLMSLVIKFKLSFCGINNGKYKRVIYFVNYYFIFRIYGLSKYRENINLYSYFFIKFYDM